MDKTTKKMMTAVQKLCTEQVVKGQSKQFFQTGDLSASVRRGGGSLNCCCSWRKGIFFQGFLAAAFCPGNLSVIVLSIGFLRDEGEY